MQMCPECGNLYDESENSQCPYCYDYDTRETFHIVYDDKRGEALELTESEYQEFKKTHPGYH